MSHNFKVGDTVRVIRPTYNDRLPKGSVHTVTLVDDKGDYIAVEEGATNTHDQGWLAERFELVEEAAASETLVDGAPAPFKVGDKVRVVKASAIRRLSLGRTHTVVSVRPSYCGDPAWMVEIDDGKSHHYADRFELVEEGPKNPRFEVGDRVRCVIRGRRLNDGQEYVVTSARPGASGGLVSLHGVGPGHEFFAERFELVEEPEEPEAPVVRDPEPSVLIVDPSPAHVRSYDFNAGDQRFFDREEALNVARARVKDRGCRQQVRSVTIFPGDEALVPRWLVQDI